jgi:hypothetical protein
MFLHMHTHTRTYARTCAFAGRALAWGAACAAVRTQVHRSRRGRAADLRLAVRAAEWQVRGSFLYEASMHAQSAPDRCISPMTGSRPALILAVRQNRITAPAPCPRRHNLCVDYSHIVLAALINGSPVRNPDRALSELREDREDALHGRGACAGDGLIAESASPSQAPPPTPHREGPHDHKPQQQLPQPHGDAVGAPAGAGGGGAAGGADASEEGESPSGAAAAAAEAEGAVAEAGGATGAAARGEERDQGWPAAAWYLADQVGRGRT